MTAEAVSPLEALYEEQSFVLDEALLAERYPVFGDFGKKLGRTPLVEIPGPEHGARIFGKCEWENPEGSIKDRVAYALLGSALLAHGDRPLDQLRVIEYSGGNLSRALSKLCAELGIRSRFVLSSASPPSLLNLLDERGVQVDLVDRDEGFLAVVRYALQVVDDDPTWTLLYQHRNPANLWYQEASTGAEMLEQTENLTLDAWVASIGTGGTLIGVLRALRSRHSAIRAIGVTPSELPYGSREVPNGRPKYAGSGGMGNGIRQPFVTLHDDEIEHRSVGLPQTLRAMAEFFDETGVRIGSSAAANWLVAKEIAAELPRSGNVVTVLPDAGTPEEWEKAGR